MFNSYKPWRSVSIQSDRLFFYSWFILDDYSNVESTVPQQESSSVKEPSQSVEEQLELRESLVRFSAIGLVALALSFVVNFSV